MHFEGNRLLMQGKSEQTGHTGRNRLAGRSTRLRHQGNLRAAAVVLLGLTAGMPPQVFAQQTENPANVLRDLPAAPVPTPTDPLYLRPSVRDFSKPYAPLWGNPLKTFGPTTIAPASFTNSVRLNDLVKDGKIYLSLSDALALALENNYDIAIARYDLDIADTDILRAKSGNELLGAPSGLITGTLGGSSSTLTTGGGPGGSSVGSGGAGSGSSGLSLTTNGAGPAPEAFDPSLTAAIQFDRQRSPSASFFSGGTSSTNTYDFTYNEGFSPGTAFTFAFNNTYATATNSTDAYSPQLSSSYKATITQHLLQGRGIWLNKRFIYQAINDRRITDSSFRQQLLYTVNQVENIYWALVSSYEDLQAKERALEQSKKVASDDRRQLEIGTMAPLDVVTADSSVAADQEALITSQSNLNYQQQIIKQAIARNLNDPALVAAPVIPTDRVSLDELPEEKQPIEELVQEAFKQRPELEQAVLTLKNDEITVKGARNALEPTFDVFGYLSGQGIAGSINPNLDCAYYPAGECPLNTVKPTGYGTALGHAFNNSAPDKGIGFNVTVPIRNRVAQSVQARSLMEYRQAQLRLEQLYTQIRMQVINAQFALTNDRAAVLAAEASQKFNAQSLDAEQKKLNLGASTTALVLQQSRNLATAENSLTSSRAAYAQARASLYQLLATTLQHYGISLDDAATGVVKAAPIVPGLELAKPSKEPTLPTPGQTQQVPTQPVVTPQGQAMPQATTPPQ